VTIRQRLTATLGLLAVILVLPSVYGLERLEELRGLTSEQRERHTSARVALGTLRTAFSDYDHALRSYVAAPSPSSRTSMHEALAEADGALDRLREAGYGDRSDATARPLSRIDSATSRIEALADSGRVEAATEAFRRVRPLVDEARFTLGATAAAVDRRTAEIARDARDISEDATTTLVIAVAGALLLAVVVGLRLTRSLTRPIHGLRTAMGQVAEGELETPDDLPYDRKDEIGDLTRSFRTMTEKLSELQRLRGEFMGLASHKLKTPLNVVAGYADLLEEELSGRLEPSQQELVEAIQEQVGVLSRDVGRLLDLSRMESGRMDVRREPFRLADMLRAVEASYRPTAERRDIEFTVASGTNHDATVVGDEERLRRNVLGNLLDNALKFSQAGGRVELRGRLADGSLLLEVEDDGLGIPEDDLPHIFEKYYQSDRSARSLGTGLGLAISREVVEAHGGSIEAESRRDAGTLFRVVVPQPDGEGEGAA
jgi:two-component system sensor histidine kinase GlrK